MSTNRNSILIVGNLGVGKSSLLRLLSEQQFNSDEETSIDVSFRTVDYDCKGLKLKIAIWNPSSEPRYEEALKIYIRDVTAAIVVYDINDKNSFKRTNNWINRVREFSTKIKVISLVGNKIDMRDNHNKMQVTEKEGMDLASMKNVLFFETSAKININVSELFSKTLIRLVANCAPNTKTSKKDKYKVIFLGDSGVGKSCLIERLVGRAYFADISSTVGTHFHKIKKKLNNHSIELDIWDTSGKERFDAIMPLYHSRAHGVVLVYDITDEKTFKNLNKWIEKLKEFKNDSPFVMLLGNKIDDGIQRKVKELDGKTFMDKNFVINKFKEVSAKSHINFDQLLNEISLNLIEIYSGFFDGVGIVSETQNRLVINCVSNTMTSLQYKYKVMVLGDSNVGKTCLVDRFTGRNYRQKTDVTRGINFNKIKRKLNNHSIELSIWDTTGHEKLFDVIMPTYFRGLHALILVYDITNERSFRNLKKWIEKVQHFDNENPLIIILGNKRDGAIHRQVDEFESKRYMDRNFIINKFKEVSAKSDDNFDELINEISHNLIKIFPVISYQHDFQLVEDTKFKKVLSSAVAIEW